MIEVKELGDEVKQIPKNSQANILETWNTTRIKERKEGPHELIY
jgi:hypothetical protein